MTFHRRLIPTAALVVAIGASAAGAATAAATGSGGGAGSGAAAGKAQKAASCKVELPGGAFKKGVVGKGTEVKGTEVKGTEIKGSGFSDAEKAKLAAAGGKGQIESKTGGKPPADPCEKKVETVGLDQIAAEIGVSKAALVRALDASKQWVAATTPTPGVAQFEQHLAGLLNVPVAKVAAALKPGLV